MVIDLINAVIERLRQSEELTGADIRAAINPRFNPEPENKLIIIVAPVALRYTRDTRDTVKETTIISVALYKYFANVFDETDPYGLLKLTPAVESALMFNDIKIYDELYRWESSYSAGDPFNDTLQTTEGGMFDVQAADNAFTIQAPILVTYTRILGVVK